MITVAKMGGGKKNPRDHKKALVERVQHQERENEKKASKKVSSFSHKGIVFAVLTILYS